MVRVEQVERKQLAVEAALRPLRNGFDELRTRVQQQTKDISGQVNGVNTRLDALQQQMAAMMDAVHTMSKSRVAARSRKNVTSSPPRTTGGEARGLASQTGTGTGICASNATGGSAGARIGASIANASAVGAATSTADDERQELRELQAQETPVAIRSSPFEA